MIDKTEILKLLLARLDAELRNATASQNAAQDGATHPEARQEDPKDTRAIEGQYLARGLAEQVELMRDARARCARLELITFGPDDPIAISALVALEEKNGDESIYFMVPWGAGEAFELNGMTVRVLTPKSPLGRALIGKRVDDEIDLELPGRRLQATIAWAR